jgi:hypothetical protein
MIDHGAKLTHASRPSNRRARSFVRFTDLAAREPGAAREKPCHVGSGGSDTHASGDENRAS